MDRGAMAPLAWQRDRVVALVNPDEVWAFQPLTGERLWRREIGGEAGAASMAVDAEGIYVALGSRLLKVTPADGSIAWQRTLTGVLSEPAVARDRVFVGSDANAFFALDPDDGRIAWTWPRLGGDVIGSVADKDVVYVASLDNMLRALNRGNGNQRWKHDTPTRPVQAPRLLEGVVVVIGIGPALSTFSARNGMPISTYDAPAELQGPPLIDAELKPFRVTVAAITRDGRVAGLRPVAMMFRDAAPTPFTTLPGRPLLREPAPKPRPQDDDR